MTDAQKDIRHIKELGHAFWDYLNKVQDQNKPFYSSDISLAKSSLKEAERLAVKHITS